MERRGWFLILVWMIVQNATADPVIGFGVKAGADLAWQNLPPLLPPEASETTREYLYGLNGGIFGDLTLVDFLSLQCEAQFIQKGFSATTKNFTVVSSGGTTLGTTTVVNSNTYDYLEIPLLIKTNLVLGPGWKGYLFAGPSMAFLVGETNTLTVNASGNVPYSQVNVDDTGFYPITEWSLIFGIGVEYKNFLLEFRQERGLDSASPNYDSDRSYGQNNAVCFQLGYRLL